DFSPSVAARLDQQETHEPLHALAFRSKVLRTSGLPSRKNNARSLRPDADSRVFYRSKTTVRGVGFLRNLPLPSALRPRRFPPRSGRGASLRAQAEALPSALRPRRLVSPEGGGQASVTH